MSALRALLALVLAGSVLAGCVSVPSETPGADLDPSGALPATGTLGVLHGPDAVALPLPAAAERALGGQFFLGADATEPTVGADGKGAVYMTAFAPGGPGAGGPTILRSMDKGQTWEDVGPKLPTGGPRAAATFDPYVHVDRTTGRVFVDDIWPLSCGQMSFSDDQGATWTTNPYSCGNSQLNDHQTVGTAKPRVVTTVGYPNVVYRCVNNGGYAACAMSYTGGLAFTPQVPIPAFSPAQGCAAITGHLASDPEGRMFLATGICDAGPTVAVTEDDGLTWTTYVIDPETPIEEGEHDVELASDEAGNLYAAWTSAGKVVLSRSTDHGKTWSKARDVTAPSVTATMFATVAAAGPGKVAFAYIGTTIEGGYEGKPSGIGGLMGDLQGEPDPEEWHEATWNAYVGVVEDALSDNFTIETVTANDPADPIARGLCGRTRCHGMNDFIDVEIDEEGRPWAAFVDVCTEACVTDPGTRWDQSQGFVGTLVRGPSLLAAGGRLPAIAAPPVAS